MSSDQHMVPVTCLCTMQWQGLPNTLPAAGLAHNISYPVLTCAMVCFQEHLFLVCELLRANLYEFQKYNRENGDEPYFTLPRLQRIAHQVGATNPALPTVPLCSAFQ